jgi:hypothetical protein
MNARNNDDDDRFTVYVQRGRKCFGITMDEKITLRYFSRAIQHPQLFGIRKRNLRLSVLQEDGRWIRFYSWRVRSHHDKMMYDQTLLDLGIIDGTILKVEYVLSRQNIVALTVATVVAIPVAASASMAAYGIVNVSFLLGYVTGTLGAKATYQRIYAKATAILLPRDMPEGILEIKRL